MISYEGLTKAEVLAALWNGSHTQGMSFLAAVPGHDRMTMEEAEDIIQKLSSRLYFDYLEGRVLKVDLRSDEPVFDEYYYDRDCGEGAAAMAIYTALKEKEKAH